MNYTFEQAKEKAKGLGYKVVNEYGFVWMNRKTKSFSTSFKEEKVAWEDLFKNLGLSIRSNPLPNWGRYGYFASGGYTHIGHISESDRKYSDDGESFEHSGETIYRVDPTQKFSNSPVGNASGVRLKIKDIFGTSYWYDRKGYSYDIGALFNNDCSIDSIPYGGGIKLLHNPTGQTFYEIHGAPIQGYMATVLDEHGQIDYNAMTPYPTPQPSPAPAQPSTSTKGTSSGTVNPGKQQVGIFNGGSPTTIIVDDLDDDGTDVNPLEDKFQACIKAMRDNHYKINMTTAENILKKAGVKPKAMFIPDNSGFKLGLSEVFADERGVYEEKHNEQE